MIDVRRRIESVRTRVGGAMAANRIAIIEISAQDVRLKVYELSAKKGANVIDTVRRMVPVGKDTYNEGRISAAVLSQLCTAIRGFGSVLEEYRITECYVLAASAVRLAKNCEMVVDQIRVRTGLNVRVLSNSEQRFMRVKGVVYRESNFKLLDKGTALVDIGSGSLQISIYEKKVLATTQNIMLGTAKIGEMFFEESGESARVEYLLKELIDNDIQTFEKMFLKEHVIKNVILVGDSVMSFIRRALERPGRPGIAVEDIKDLYERVKGKSAGEISLMLEIDQAYAAMVIPVLILSQTLLDATGADTVWIPQSDMCDGFAVDYMERHKIGKADYDFEEDIIASSKTICKRYKGNASHAQSIERTATQFFDALRRLHGLGERERLLLRISSILHDCGKFISMSAPGDCSYHIIMSTEILGLSHAEREMVANIVRYNTKELPDYSEFDGKLSNDEYLIVMKLAAILRVSNALDRSHKQKFADSKLVVKNQRMVVITEYMGDITLERSTLEAKSQFFEEVYGLKLELKQKRKK